MGNLMEYIRWRGDIPFSAIPLCEADYLIFSHLSYLDFQGIVPFEEHGEVSLVRAFEQFEQKREIPKGIHSGFLWEEVVPMFRELSQSPRYRNCMLSAYECLSDEPSELQFAALTLTIPGRDGRILIFRGTDDTLVGWKENLNMAFLTPIPAQKSALEYLLRNFRNTPVTLIGHSKGGNLAVFAAANAASEVQDSIQEVWNFDGPGFDAGFFRSEGYRRVRNRIRMFVPESSVFGMMFRNDGHYRVVKSSAKGVMQHDGFSWELIRGNFSYAAELSAESRMIYRIMNTWLSGLKYTEREEIVNCVYKILISEKFTCMTEVKSSRKRILMAYLHADSRSRRMILRATLPLIRIWKAVKNPAQKDKQDILHAPVFRALSPKTSGRGKGKPAVT